MPSNDSLLYLKHRYCSREWYESFDRYQPTSELLHIVNSALQRKWYIRRDSIWVYTHSSDIKLPRQGWKIHVSATPINCENILRKVASICIEKGASFKFLIDRYIVKLSTSKAWSREASGKFITIYPLNDQHFYELLEILYPSLQEFNGPYILSDRRYKDSRVLYYRYGGIDGLRVLVYNGGKEYMLESPDGSLYPDWRMPYWSPPPWALDPFEQDDIEEQNDKEEEEPTLNNGRYRIQKALTFSATGGVYIATDLDTGSDVVIKEARPATAIDEYGKDAIDRLRKEYRLLQVLQDTNITPKPIELFMDWEHLYLVEEYIPGLDLGHFTIAYNPLMRVQPSEMDINNYCETLRKIWVNLAAGITAIHDKNITCGDLSIKNVMVENVDLGEVRIVDLEAAWEKGIDNPIDLMTPGFANPSDKLSPGKENDFYSLGATMLGTLFPLNSFLEVEPSAKQVFTQALGADLGISEQIQQVIQACMSDSPSKRPSASQVAEVIRRSPSEYVKSPSYTPAHKELVDIIDGITDYIRASADPYREDRLFPADPYVFLTNPLNIAYGALGVAYALSRIEGEVPRSALAWILTRPVNPEHYPPGLYIGMSGIAWAFWEIGCEDVGLRILQNVHTHPLLWDVPDLFYGASGYGLTCLRFHLATGDQVWLDRAVQIGTQLAHSTDRNVLGCSWPDKEGYKWIGYAHGSSGIALFLLYLHLATGSDSFLKLGQNALAFALTHAKPLEGEHLSIPRGAVGSFENVVSHYWLDGSAGVATVLLRFWAYTKNNEYFDLLKRLVPDTCRKYTSFPGLFRGLSGLGNFLLDAYDFTGDEHYLHEAYRTASGIALFKTQKSTGVAFPGEQLLRISTDFGTGSSGIALFLHRLIHSEQRLGNFNFTLDQLLKSKINH